MKSVRTKQRFSNQQTCTIKTRTRGVPGVGKRVNQRALDGIYSFAITRHRRSGPALISLTRFVCNPIRPHGRPDCPPPPSSSSTRSVTIDKHESMETKPKDWTKKRGWAGNVSRRHGRGSSGEIKQTQRWQQTKRIERGNKCARKQLVPHICSG